MCWLSRVTGISGSSAYCGHSKRDLSPSCLGSHELGDFWNTSLFPASGYNNELEIWLSSLKCTRDDILRSEIVFICFFCGPPFISVRIYPSIRPSISQSSVELGSGLRPWTWSVTRVCTWQNANKHKLVSCRPCSDNFLIWKLCQEFSPSPLLLLRLGSQLLLTV